MTERNKKLIEQLKDRIEKTGEISAIYEAHELIGEEVEFD